MLEKQMELFEEGGQVDPVSGNDVPLGSTEKEVRDDQPAMLSEGEMVIPADVVRYFGVEHFMKLRDEAKMGYKKMEAMGQFGTDEGKTLPDDTLFNAGGPPFTIEDIEVIEPDDLESLEGGEEDTLEANAGVFVQGGQGTNPFDNNAATTAGQQFAAGKPITASSFNQSAFDINDIIKSIGGINFDYLNTLAPKGTNFSDITERGKKVFDNYFTSLSKNLSAAVQSPTTAGVDSESEDQDVGPTAGQGIGSMSELSSAPTAANIEAAREFANYSPTTIGIMNSMISGALNPFGSMFGPPGIAGKVAGMLSGAFTKGTVGLPFGIGPSISVMNAPSSLKGNIDKVATMDQLAAKAIVNVADRTPQVDLDLMSIVGIAEQMGFDVNDIANNPNEDLVSIDNDPNGIGVGVQTPGQFGHVNTNPNDPTGGSIVANPQINNTFSKADIEKALQLQRDFEQNVTETMQMMHDPAIDRGMGGGPQSGLDAMGGVNAGAVGGKDDGTGSDDTGPGGGNTGPAAAEAAADVAAGADPAGNEAAAAAASEAEQMGGGPQSEGEAGGEGGQDGEGGEDSGPEGIAKGGLIKRKPRRKKKKKRGGLGSRK